MTIRPGPRGIHRSLPGHTFVILLALALGASPARSQAGPETTGPPGLDSLRAAYLAAYDRGDASAMQNLYVPTAVRMPYDAPAQEGREAILAYYRQSFSRRRVDPTLTFTVGRVSVIGDLAVERGRYREEWRPRSGRPPRVELGKYVTIARRGEDGRWRYDTSIFNRNAAPGSGPGTG